MADFISSLLKNSYPCCYIVSLKFIFCIHSRMYPLSHCSSCEGLCFDIIWFRIHRVDFERIWLVFVKTALTISLPLDRSYGLFP